MLILDKRVLIMHDRQENWYRRHLDLLACNLPDQVQTGHRVIYIYKHCCS